MKRAGSARGVFEDYALYYDLFYEKKDYRKESQYVLDLLKKHLKRMPRSILDLGCGTGGHALLWASRGLSVTGIDLSEEMLGQARRKAKRRKLPVRFVKGDVRSFQLGDTFDAVASMFAVMSYQTSRADLMNTFQCVRAHLPEGGVFLFDSWFGPGVRSSPPGDRVRMFRHKGLEIIRTVTSQHRAKEHVVNVNYDIIVLKSDRVVARIKEKHPMHYFFPEDVKNLASRTGFALIDCHPFLQSDQPVRDKDWTVTFVLKAAQIL